MASLTPLRLPLAALFGALLACVTEGRIEDELEEANYCEATDECVSVYPGCPLGCERLINTHERERIESLIERYHKTHRDTCVYDCVGLVNIRCEAGRCVADDAL